MKDNKSSVLKIGKDINLATINHNERSEFNPFKFGDVVLIHFDQI